MEYSLFIDLRHLQEQLWKLWDKNMQLEQQMEEAQKRYEDLLRKMVRFQFSLSFLLKVRSRSDFCHIVPAFGVLFV
jgi:hypothetical protein